jgi:hypothetical protein
LVKGETLRLDPNDVPTLLYLARILAADKNAAVRGGLEAAALAMRAEAIAGGQPLALDTLAMAYAESGRFEDAQDAVRKALERAAASGKTNNILAMSNTSVCTNPINRIARSSPTRRRDELDRHPAVESCKTCTSSEEGDGPLRPF